MLEHSTNVFKERIEEVRTLVSNTNKASVLVIQQFPSDNDTITLLPKIRESVTNVLAFVELGSEKVLERVLELANPVFDFVAFDGDLKIKNSADLIACARKVCTSPKLFFYSDNQTWADSGLHMVSQLENGLYQKKVWLTGSGILREALAQKLTNLGAEVQYSAVPGQLAEIVIGAQVKEVSFPEDGFSSVLTGANFYDIGIGNFSKKTISEALNGGGEVYRIDVRAGLSSQVLQILETNYLITKVMGRAELRGVRMVAGGIMGEDGAVVVDDIRSPTSVVGIADGKGSLKLEINEKETEHQAFVSRLIKKV
jgi:hypothetical protein